MSKKAKNIRDFQTVQLVSKIFTDREKPRNVFWKKYRNFKENMHKDIENDVTIITYYGIGGIGKTSLLGKLQVEIDESNDLSRSVKEDILYVHYDLKNYCNKRIVMESIRKLLIDRYQFSFPIFDIANTIYRLRTGEDSTIDKINSFFEKNKIASFIVDIIGAVPVVGSIVPVAANAIDTIISVARNKYSSRKLELSELQNEKPEDILKNLQVYFAYDIVVNLEKQKKPLVIFLDTYEALVNELACIGEPLLADDWLRNDKNGLIIHSSGILWVISGREKLKWEKFDEEWKENLSQHLIGNLSNTDAISFLTKAGVDDLSLREEIYDTTHGTPIYLDLCVNNYFSLIENDEVPTIEKIGCNTETLIERFLRYMDDNKKDMVYLLALLDEWTEEEIVSITGVILPGVAHTTIERTKDYSFISCENDMKYRMHQTMKDVLIKSCPKSIFRKTNEYLAVTLKNTIEQTSPMDSSYSLFLNKYIRNYLSLERTVLDMFQFYNEEISIYIRKLDNAYQYEEICQTIATLINLIKFDASDSLLKATLYVHYSYYLSKSGNYNNMVYFADEAHKNFLSLLGEADSKTITVMANLSSCYAKAGRNSEALELSEKVLALRKTTLGETHPDTIYAMNDLSIRYADAGRSSEALELAKKALTLMKTILGETHPDTVNAMNNLSVQYANTGRNSEALDLSEKVFALWITTLGEHHPETVRAIINLSNRYADAGRDIEALVLAKKALALRKVILGETHPDTVTAMNNLAVQYANTGRNSEALDLSEKVLALRIATLGEHHPETVRAINNLSIRYADAGRDIEALALAKKALALMKTILGETHPDTVRAMNNLAVRYANTGRNSEALELSEKAIVLMKTTVGETHPDTLRAMINLSNRYANTGRNSEALDLSEKVLALTKTILGEHHPDTVRAMMNLSNRYANTGRNGEALDLSEKVLALTKTILGEHHPDTVRDMINLSIRYANVARKSEALDLAEKALTLSKKTLGKTHPETVRAMNNLAILYAEAGRNSEALDLSKK